MFGNVKEFMDSWIGSILFAMVLTSAVGQAFVIPSGSMKNTLKVGDVVIGQKFAYGIPTPRIPWINKPMLPDFFGNGHLIEGEKPKRGDVVIFLYPKDTTTHYVKRCVAKGGDEILYLNHKLYIHFYEGDAYIRSHYLQKKIASLQGKLWVENPYMDKHPGIGYRDQDGGTLFDTLLTYAQRGKAMDMKPVYVSNLDAPNYRIRGRIVNALYTKVPTEQFYMIGDNRENSNDSRFWGAVPYKNIIGKPWFALGSVDTKHHRIRWERFGRSMAWLDAHAAKAD